MGGGLVTSSSSRGQDRRYHAKLVATSLTICGLPGRDDGDRALVRRAYGWALIVVGFSYNGLIGPKFSLRQLFRWWTFVTMAKAALAGQAFVIFDVARFSEALG